MKLLRTSGNYLKTQARIRLFLATYCMVTLVFLLLSAIQPLPFYVPLGDYGMVRTLVMISSAVMLWYWWCRYQSYKYGFAGERHVTQLLKSALPDDYYLINNVIPRQGHGNIDHVVLSPRGIFVIETKNWSGKITCHANQWSRKRGNPSKQVKVNALRIKDIICSMGQFNSRKIWVEAIVVFSNYNAKLSISEPTVEIKRPYELPRYLLEYKGSTQFSLHELDLMGKEILRQTK
jgi:hypothetical protein